MQVTLDLQKMIDEQASKGAETAAISVTSCNHHSCGGGQVAALEKLAENVDQPPKVTTQK